MTELTVRYEASSIKRVPRHARELVISTLSAELFEPWRRAINDGSIDEVVILGQCCTGWRIWVDRPVRFVTTIPTDRHNAMCQEQAAHRILQKGQTTVETVSPFNLVQEFVDKDLHYPWRVLVACTLLNRTHGRQVRPAIEGLMRLCRQPSDLLSPEKHDAIMAVLQPLGLKTVRFKRLSDLTEDYLNKMDFVGIRGAGPYAYDSLQLFCYGRTDLQPSDQWLEPYRQWRLNGGPRVEWDREGHNRWRSGK